MNLPELKLPDWLLKFRKPVEMDEDLKSLETELSEKLLQIEPDPHYVISLRQKLLKQFPNVELAPLPPQHRALQTGLLVTGGILGSAFVLMTGVRGIVSLIGIVGLIISWIKQNSRDSLLPSDLAN